MKGKGKVQTKAYDEYEELKATTCRRLSLMEQFNNNQQVELDLKIIMTNITTMNQTQREIHAKMLKEIKTRM